MTLLFVEGVQPGVRSPVSSHCIQLISTIALLLESNSLHKLGLRQVSAVYLGGIRWVTAPLYATRTSLGQ